jgi:hypothetical protein
MGDVVALALDSAGNLYIGASAWVWKVAASTGILTLAAGNGGSGNSGDGLLAVNAEVYPNTNGLVVDATGNIYIAGTNSTIRKVNTSTGVISTIAGSGYTGFWGDGGSAGVAEVQYITGIALDTAGSVYFSDEGNYRVRKLTF